MLDGQGCLLPVRHFHPEDSPLILSCCSGHYITCRAEASAETSPNSNPNLLPQSVEACPCSPAPKVDQEFIHGELPDLNISSACHGSPLACVEADSADSNGQLAEQGDLPCISLQFDCSSTSLSRSFMGAEVGVGQTRSSHAKPDSTSSEFCRLASEGESLSIVSGENELPTEFAEAASSTMKNEEEGLSRREGGARDLERVKRTTCLSCLCKREDAEASDCKERCTGAECSAILQNVSRYLDSSDFVLGLACAAKICTKSKEADESLSECGNAEKINVKHSSLESSATQGGRLEYQGADCHKKKRIISCIETSHDTSPGNAVIHANTELACNSNDDHSSQQQPYLPGLDDESALRCLALVPLPDLGKLTGVCRSYRDLVKSRLIFKLRQIYGTVEHLVFIYTSGPAGWTRYDANRNAWRTLPPANVDPAFDLSDRESLSAGTHVLWFGKETFEFVYYRYDLLTNGWEKGPSMINPRCLFASASCGDFAFVAGGFGPADQTGALTLLNSAERYNSLTGEWERLPPMSTPRHKCSGFFMDCKFYVIGGRDANHEPITSGEEYNPRTGVWRTIPNMFFAPEIPRRDMFEPSPPLVAVVNNQLYAVENTTNALKVYNKHSNTWSNLGYLPVPAYLRNGWGVAFKALGDRLFVMGDLEGIAACCWQPGPTVTEPVWQLLSRRERGEDSFLFNCAVMTY